MTAQEVRDHVITIFTAGHETTAMAMTWTWYLLSQHPAEEAKLHAELRAVLGGRAPNSEDLGKLTYTRMVIEESMRLYPPVHTIAREALADDTLAGRHVPKGSAVLIAPWVLHRHPQALAESGTIRPRAILAGAGRRTTPLLVSSLRWRTSYMHWSGFRDGGSDDSARYHRAAIPTATRGGASGRASGADYASCPPWDENDASAASRVTEPESRGDYCG